MTSEAGFAAVRAEERPPATRFGFFFLALFVLGSCLRLTGVERPIELPNNWREFDVATVARNFEREDMNILMPRIDWRGDGPGYVEMELPIYPWAGALAYKVFGEHEIILRLISCAFSIGSLGLFIALARRLLPPVGALAATVLFMLNPLANFVGSAVQPEGLMLLAYLAAIYYFLIWLDSGRRWPYILSAGFTALAILAKSPAAHIGLFFLLLLLRSGGVRKLLDPRVLTFPIWTLGPALLWHRHAYNLFRIYGNSLGASNEDHFIGLDILASPRLWGGIVGNEALFVWGLFGFVVAIHGLIVDRSKPVAAVAGLWLATVLLYAVLCGRTLAGLWAWYYHIVAVPPAALLFGHGFASLSRVPAGSRLVAAVLSASGVLAAIAWTWLGRLVRAAAPQYASQLVGKSLALPVEALLVLMAVAACLAIFANAAYSGTRRPDWLYWVALACVVPSYYMAAELLVQRALFQDGARLRTAALTLAPLIPAQSKIVAIGGACGGSDLHKFVASDAPFLFYWLDRKGYSLCRESVSVENLRPYAARGAGYFVAEKELLSLREGLEAGLARSFVLAGESGGLQVYALEPPAEAPRK